ncbi:MAG: synthase subunit [Verrucomicrobiota bacterium]|jgi:F-type H+-transporting ATPase subunit a
MSAEAASTSASRGIESANYINHHVMEVGHSFFGIPLPHGIYAQHVAIVVSALLVITAFCLLYKKKARVPHGFTHMLEVLVVFIRDEVVCANMGKEEGRKWTPYFLTLFFFILVMNLIGLIPNGCAATGHIAVTSALALCTFFFMTFFAIAKNGIKQFFHAFLPSGVPGFILPGIFVIEFMGVFVKSFALAVRLFANMMGGHIALFVFISLVHTFGLMVAPLSGPLSIALYGLETGVAFLQAYVFTLLSVIFIQQVLHPEH